MSGRDENEVAPLELDDGAEMKTQFFFDKQFRVQISE